MVNLGQFDDKLPEYSRHDTNQIWNNKAEEASNNLVRVCDSIVKNGGKAPIMKCAIYGVGNLAYKDDNGVYIVPITSLKD